MEFMPGIFPGLGESFPGDTGVGGILSRRYQELGDFPGDTGVGKSIPKNLFIEK
jgi:hypothetical protein